MQSTRRHCVRRAKVYRAANTTVVHDGQQPEAACEAASGHLSLANQKMFTTCAERTIRQYNANALVSTDGDLVYAIEDCSDSDGRMYRLEYIATADATKAAVYCRYNPWASSSDLSACEEYTIAHIRKDGYVCVGTGIHEDSVYKSPFSLEYVIKRARYWCTAYSYFKETRDTSAFTL
jgi:hypothetical protein